MGILPALRGLQGIMAAGGLIVGVGSGHCTVLGVGNLLYGVRRFFSYAV